MSIHPGRFVKYISIKIPGVVMYTLSNLQRIIHPKGVVGAIHHFLLKPNQLFYRIKGSSDYFKVAEKEWENLLILDGCRYDMFSEQCTLEGELQKVRSPTSWSWGFLKENFEGSHLHDTVYITANPYVHRLSNKTFHTVVNLLDDEWDESLETVPPASVSSALYDVRETYPEKRIIAHFMQPHYPFIGPKGQGLNQGGISSKEDGISVQESDIWRSLQFGLDDLSTDDVWEAYRENLDIVLNEVDQLLDDLDGRTVITSDHGNMVGEWISPVPARVWGHPPNVHAPELVDVPWFEIEGEPRPVTEEAPQEHTELESDMINDRLRSLGYK